MPDFIGIQFKERGAGEGKGFPVWEKGGNIVLKKIPGSGDTVIQVIGNKLPTLAMPVRITAQQLTDMYGFVGFEDVLSFHFETTSARLESITDVEEFHHGLDAYTAVYNFIRSSSTI